MEAFDHKDAPPKNSAKVDNEAIAMITPGGPTSNMPTDIKKKKWFCP